MGFLDAIFGSKKEIVKYCSLREMQVTLYKDNVLAHYRMNMFCSICKECTRFHKVALCDEERCVYHHWNAQHASNAMDKKLGNNPSLSNRDLHEKVERLSLDEYTDLMMNYGINKEIQNYCK